MHETSYDLMHPSWQTIHLPNWGCWSNTIPSSNLLYAAWGTFHHDRLRKNLRRNLWVVSLWMLSYFSFSDTLPRSGRICHNIRTRQSCFVGSRSSMVVPPSTRGSSSCIHDILSILEVVFMGLHLIVSALPKSPSSTTTLSASSIQVRIEHVSLLHIPPRSDFGFLRPITLIGDQRREDSLLWEWHI